MFVFQETLRLLAAACNKVGSGSTGRSLSESLVAKSLEMAANNQQQFQQSSPQQQQQQTIRNVVQQQGQIATINGQQVQIANAQPQQQQFVTINGNQQMVRVQPQVMQIPQAQQMVPVQIPVSQNGQTVYQTVQMPMAVQQPAMQTAMIPQVIQTDKGQQIVMQQVQIAQPQVQQQFAQILMPNGQLQQVQVVQPQQMFGTIGGLPQQIPIQTAGAASIAPAATTTTATLVSPVSSTSSSSSSSASMTSPVTAKLEPMEIKSEIPDTEFTTKNVTNGIATATASANQAVTQQQIATINGQQVVVQQPLNVQPSQVLSVRTANGQIVQIPNSQQGQVVQAPPQTSNLQTVHIPGLGPVQIMNAIQLPGNGTTAAQLASNGTQIVNAVPAGAATAAQFTTAQPTAATQQALQPDPNDPSKWQVVQVATANSGIPMQQAPQTAQIVTANGTVLGSATIPAGVSTTLPTAEVNVSMDGNSGGNTLQTTSNGGQQTKTRLRRVACTCPNCKDGDRSRGK